MGVNYRGSRLSNIYFNNSKSWNKIIRRVLILSTFTFALLITNFLTEIFCQGDNHKFGFYKKRNIYSDVPLPKFSYLYTNGTDGPITVNRFKADDDRFDVYKMIIDNNEEDFKSFYYDIEGFEKLEKFIEKEEYICETELQTESHKEFNIVCPIHYTININEAFYGRYANDTIHCTVNNKTENVETKRLEISETCGNDSLDIVKKICEGRPDCSIKPNKKFFGNPCNTMDIYKYLHVKYRCVKNKEFKKPNFAVVMFSDVIKVNTIYENAISEFYQYCKIHNYTFIFNDYHYDKIREIFYMKLHVIKEAIIRGLKTHEYDWIFWVDSDVILANPNIKLETFIPTDENIHFIVTADHHGLNAGVFIIKVHPWSLNFMMHSLAYQYFIGGKFLEYADQTSMNDVLFLNNEDERKHYAVVPQNWFNAYPNKRHKGDMVLHFAGRINKKRDSNYTRTELKNDPDYLKARTNQKMRQEALDFYAKPIEKQRKLRYGFIEETLWEKFKRKCVEYYTKFKKYMDTFK